MNAWSQEFLVFFLCIKCLSWQLWWAYVGDRIYHVLMTLTVWENNLKQGGKNFFIKQNSQIMQVHLECNEVLHSYKPSEIDVAN